MSCRGREQYRKDGRGGRREEEEEGEEEEPVTKQHTVGWTSLKRRVLIFGSDFARLSFDPCLARPPRPPFPYEGKGKAPQGNRETFSPLPHLENTEIL